MPTGMSEQKAKILAQQIEAEDERVKAVAQQCASGNAWYTGKTWKVIAVLKHWNLSHQCYQPRHWQSVKLAWDELCREEQ